MKRHLVRWVLALSCGLGAEVSTQTLVESGAFQRIYDPSVNEKPRLII